LTLKDLAEFIVAILPEVNKTLVTITLCLVVIIVIGALAAAILDHNIPNDPVYELIKQPLLVVVGGLVMLVGINRGRHE
jgi:hypothetical protein